MDSSVTYIKRVFTWMQIIECGSTLDGVAWCRHHTFVFNSDDKEALQWFVCAFHCRVRLERFIIWVWAPLSSISLIRPLLVASTPLRIGRFDRKRTWQGLLSLHLLLWHRSQRRRHKEVHLQIKLLDLFFPHLLPQGRGQKRIRK